MTSATAAAPVRLGAAALVVAMLAAFSVAGRADGAGAWSAYLAPVSACPGSLDRSASPAVQRRVLTCLVNWARRQDRRGHLAPSPSLVRAAAHKGRGVASCLQFSHTPCGSDLTASVHASGYRYATFGENLFAGGWGQVTPRDAVAAWLRSPGHRAIMLRRGFRDVGSALVRVRGLPGVGDAAVWVAAFGTPR